MRSSVRAYPSATTLPSAVFSAFAVGAVDEPGAEGGVGIVPGTFFTFLRGADIAYCGTGRTQTTRSKQRDSLERIRAPRTAPLH